MNLALKNNFYLIHTIFRWQNYCNGKYETIVGRTRRFLLWYEGRCRQLCMGHIIIHQSVYNYGSFRWGIFFFLKKLCSLFENVCEVDILPYNAGAEIDKVIIKTSYVCVNYVMSHRKFLNQHLAFTPAAVLLVSTKNPIDFHSAPGRIDNKQKITTYFFENA